MKAVVVASPGVVEIREIPQPVPRQDEALVRIEACGLCGTTDRYIVEGHQPHHRTDWYPAVLGHESVGVVESIGGDVKKFRVGDRVTRPLAIWPGTQRDGLWSAWGGFAEYGIVRDSQESDYNVARQHVISPDLSVEQAVAAISYAEVASWAEKLGKLNDQVILIGGTGFAACVMCQCVRAAGARLIIALGRSPKKFPWVLRNGATHAVALDESFRQNVKVATGGVGADWFLDAAGHQTVFESGLQCLRPGGKAAIYGAPDGFAYRLPLGSLGGQDFSVHYLSPQDDVYFAETCRRMKARSLQTDLTQTHVWRGLESLPAALAAQAAGDVLKGIVLLPN